MGRGTCSNTEVCGHLTRIRKKVPPLCVKAAIYPAMPPSKRRATEPIRYPACGAGTTPCTLGFSSFRLVYRAL